MKRLILLFVSILLASCGGLEMFKRHDHLSSVLQSSYSNQDMVVSDYFFCAHQRRMSLASLNFEPLEVDGDSIMGLFYEALSNRGIRLRVEEGQNRATPLLCDREFITLRQMKKRFLSGAYLGGQGTRYLVPVVNVADIYRFTGYVTSGGMGGNSGYMRYTIMSVLFFIVEDGQVIYADSRSFFSKTTMAPTLEKVKAIPPAIEVRKEHIDELVRRGMRRYVRRLEK